MRLLCSLLLMLGLAGSAAALTTPPLTDYVTYLGGSGAESVAGIAVDASGSEYVAGTTYSPNFPLTSTVLGSAVAGNRCAFITKFSPSGTGIVFSICAANSRALAFGRDSAGNLYLAIDEPSEWIDTYAVLKIDPTGQNILYKTLLDAPPESMAVDAAGNVYLAGTTGEGFGTTSGAYQTQLAPGTCPAGNGQQPCNDAFVVKIAPTGALAWATYLGGSGKDDAHAIAVDSTGSVWVAGETLSPNFPVTPNALQSTFHGVVQSLYDPLQFGDAFVAKLDPTGGTLLYSTYLGGSAPDGAFAVAVDPANSAYVTGGTQSTDFPTTAGVLQSTFSPAARLTPSLNGSAFVTKFGSSGNVVYSTYLGGLQGNAIAVDASGEAAVNSAVYGSALNCVQFAAVSVVNAAASAIAWSPVVAQYLAWDSSGGLYSAGQTATLAFLTTPHAYQPQYGGGGSDASAGKVDFTQPPGPVLASVVNAATLVVAGVQPFLTGQVAPGEIVTLFGNGFGPQPTVSFDGIAAPVLYASNCQINAVVPFGVASKTATAVSVQAGPLVIGPVQLPVVPVSLGIFTANETLAIDQVAYQAAVVNQDGTVNSPSNPAPRGTIVTFYMTGVGALSPPIADGSIGPLSPPFPEPVQSVTSHLGSVVFAGQAPGLIAGLIQVNVQIPPIAPTGAAVYFQIAVGGSDSQVVTLAVQ